MEDQATSLRKLVEEKTEYKEPTQKDVGSSSSPKEEKGARVIAITSGKGGVGKTNLTVNLAIALSKEGQRVIVVDADLGMANVDVVLGSMSRKHLLNLLDDGVNLEDVLIKGPFGVNYISGGSGIEKARDFTLSERKLLMQKLFIKNILSMLK